VGGSVMGMDSNSNSNSAAEANNPLLLRALSERMLDTDIPCAITTVGCLSNYVSFYCGVIDDVDEGRDSMGSNNEGKEDVPSLVMVPILLQRLQLSIAMLHTLGTQLQKANTDTTSSKTSNKKKGVTFNEQTKKSNTSSTSESDKLQLKTNEQYTLLSLSLVTLSGIIENCGKSALQTCGGNAYLQLLSVLNVACCSIQQQVDKKVGGSIKEKKGEEFEPMYDTVTNASRALHSLLDDNTVLIATLPLEATTSAAASSPSSLSTSPSLTAAVSQLTNTIIMNTNMPSMARLHASGSILALRRVLVLDKEHQQLARSVKLSQDEEQIASAIQSCTNEVILPYLASIYDQFTTNQSNVAKQLLQDMISTSNQLSSIKQDLSLESQIVSKINAKKEPAREIARRQKKMKEENKKDDDVQAMEEENTTKDVKESSEAKAAVSNDEESEVSMAIEEDAVTEEEKKQEQEDELKDKLDGIVSKWKDIVGSHKLALELVANLCSPNEEEEEDEGEEGMYGDDDDEHMWDSDDEAKLLAEAAHGMGKSVAAATVTPCEQATYDAMITEQCNLPMRILSFFRQWAEFIPSSDTTMDVETKVPILVSQDVDELLSTCALCLGNVVACNVLKEKSTLEAFWKDLVSMLKSQYHVHVTSVILSLVRNEPLAPTLVDSSTLESLITLLQQSGTSDAEALLKTHTNIISILGVLCAEPHPATINTQVCRALLERLRSSSTSGNDLTGQSMKHSVITTHEILNALMDMYGNDDDDDCHNQVFASEDVLGHFQRCLPGFKRCIKKVSGSASRGASMEEEIEVDLWNETALNTSRFIKYKRDKCV